PPARPERRRDRTRRLAGALASADELDRVQARPFGSQDHHRLRRAGADTRTVAPADAADDLRYPRRGPWNLEQLETSASRRTLRIGRRTHPSRPQAAWTEGTRRGEEGQGRRTARTGSPLHRRNRRPFR